MLCLFLRMTRDFSDAPPVWYESPVSLLANTVPAKLTASKLFSERAAVDRAEKMKANQ